MKDASHPASLTVVQPAAHCPVLPADTVATVNGKPLRAISLGTFDGAACYVPQ